jgi:hypothetical protein
MMDRVPYASLVGSLIFAMVCTRPDIAYSVGESPKKKHRERSSIYVL